MCLFFVCWDDEHFDRNTTVIRCHGNSTLTVLPRLTKLLDCRRHTILYYIIDAIQCYLIISYFKYYIMLYYVIRSLLYYVIRSLLYYIMLYYIIRSLIDLYNADRASCKNTGHILLRRCKTQTIIHNTSTGKEVVLLTKL